VKGSGAIESTLRELAPQVLGLLVRRYGDFAACEDAVQEALIDAATQWDEVPEHPRGWLITVATRRLIDARRSDASRDRREERAFRLEPDARDGADATTDGRFAAAEDAPAAGGPTDDPQDDSLGLLFLCCHPDLSQPSQLALTLRSLAGLTTEEIARAFLVPTATMAQRLSRAKKQLRGVPFGVPPAPERGPRLAVVLQVVYLLHTEGDTAGAGDDLQRPELTTEALRLARLLHDALPEEGEVSGLLALLLLAHARRDTRTDDGALVPLADQDRSAWDRTAIAEADGLITGALARSAPGPYLLQAAIAAVHVAAPSVEETDWPQILGLYDLLLRIAPNPVTALNRAVVVGEVDGPQAGLLAADEVADDPRIADHHRLWAVRAHLLERAGDPDGAAAAFDEAARRTGSVPEREHLQRRAERARRGVG
jgi:RNA polymerase sigma factor (sigma-70 family)